MIALGLDLETTGLDKTKDRPIEVGLTLWSTNYNRSLETHNFCIQSDGVTVTPEITRLTGVTPKMSEQGWTPEDAYEEVEHYISRADAIVAFNGRRFDIPMLHSWAKRLGKEFPAKFIIDPSTDLPDTNDAPSPPMPREPQITMCARRGIYYPAHEAGADVNAMLRLMATAKFEYVLKRAESPLIVVQSHQNRNENRKASKHKFRWNPDKKVWWRAIQEIDLDYLHKQINNEFPISECQYPLEVLDTND